MTQGATAKGDYTYDGRQRLATRIVSNVTGANGTSHILHGYVGCPEPMNENALAGGTPCDRILAETDGTGPAGTKREYIWLGEMPVAVIDKTVTPNKTLMVHADHLNRPYFMTDSTRAVVFKAVYEPFGATYSVTGTAALNTLRFPGQWFQLESGLAYNWHRHYDATLGRYVSADPLGLVDGASVYGYVRQAPLELVDPEGRLAFIPVLVGAAAGLVFDYGVSKIRENCSCTDNGSALGPLGYSVAGATAGGFGPFEQKPRTGISGGGPSGNKTSSYSKLISKGTKDGLYTPSTGNTLRAGGKVVSKSLPYLGAALAITEAYRLWRDCR